MKREINFKSVEWLFWVLHGKLGKIELEDWVKKEEEIKGQQGSCKSCLPCFIAVVLDFDQRLLGNKDKTNNKKEMEKIRHFNIWGPKPPGPKWKRAETSGGQIRKGPKPLATVEISTHLLSFSLLGKIPLFCPKIIPVCRDISMWIPFRVWLLF